MWQRYVSEIWSLLEERVSARQEGAVGRDAASNGGYPVGHGGWGQNPLRK